MNTIKKIFRYTWLTIKWTVIGTILLIGLIVLIYTCENNTTSDPYAGMTPEEKAVVKQLEKEVKERAKNIELVRVCTVEAIAIVNDIANYYPHKSRQAEQIGRQFKKQAKPLVKLQKTGDDTAEAYYDLFLRCEKAQKSLKKLMK